MSSRHWFGLLGVFVAAIVVTELVMQPSWSERWALTGIYAGIVAAAVTAALLVQHLYLPRAKSLRSAMLVVALVAVSVASVSVAVSSGLMFFSAHDLRLLLVSLALGFGLAMVLSWAITRPLQRDLETLARAARSVAAGDLDGTTGVRREDEVGAVAEAMDGMMVRLSHAHADRARLEDARQHFLAAVSHDLRTPLASLQAALEALEDGMVEDEQRYFRAMHGDLDLLRSMVDDLFLMTRLEAGDAALERVPLDLAELADDAVEAMGYVAQKRQVDVALETDGLVKAVGAPQALSRVIRNLLDNAIRHAPPETTVRVHVANGGPSASVRVTDEGTGFDEDFVHEAFDSFTRADPARTRGAGGAGLGLAIAKGVIDAHGGRIWAEPGPGGSVVFEVPAS